MRAGTTPPLPQRHLLASTISVAIASSSGFAIAAEGQKALQLDSIKIEAARKDSRTEHSASSKYVAPLLDTPQTITVVSPKVIQEQQALSLRQVLSNVSGITFNAGEGVADLGTALTSAASLPTATSRSMACATVRKPAAPIRSTSNKWK